MPKTFERTRYKVASLTEFRRDVTRLSAWVEATGNRVWLAKHGRLVGGLVCMGDIEALDTWEGRSLEEQRRRMRVLWDRWKRIKAGEELPDLPYSFWEPEGPDRGR